MTNTIELAKATGQTKWFGTHPDGTNDFLGVEFTPEQLERFAALVRAEREWVDLTDDEILNLVTQYGIDDPHWFVHAVIAAFKEKNK